MLTKALARHRPITKNHFPHTGNDIIHASTQFKKKGEGHPDSGGRKSVPSKKRQHCAVDHRWSWGGGQEEVLEGQGGGALTDSAHEMKERRIQLDLLKGIPDLTTSTHYESNAS